MEMFLAYGIVVVVTNIALGFSNPDDDDIAGAWVVSFLWPLIVVAAAAAVFACGPFWLGQQIRKLRHYVANAPMQLQLSSPIRAGASLTMMLLR